VTTTPTSSVEKKYTGGRSIEKPKKGKTFGRIAGTRRAKQKLQKAAVDEQRRMGLESASRKRKTGGPGAKGTPGSATSNVAGAERKTPGFLRKKKAERGGLYY